MLYKIDDPKYKTYKVELDGVIQPDAVEADDVQGWVRIEKTRTFWGTIHIEKKTLYGKVFIVRFDQDPEENTHDEERSE